MTISLSYVSAFNLGPELLLAGVLVSAVSALLIVWDRPEWRRQLIALCLAVAGAGAIGYAVSYPAYACTEQALRDLCGDWWYWCGVMQGCGF